MASRGRPRRAGADSAILEASRELIVEHGSAGFSMEEVARRAGVGRQSVYRRWPSKSALLVAAMTWTRDTPDVFPDTGTVVGDLRAGLETLRCLHDASDPRVFADVHAAIAGDAVARDLFERHYLAPRRESLDRALARAVDRGELRADTDAAIVLDLVSGPFLYRRLVGSDDLPDALLDAILAAVLHLYAVGD